MPTIRSAIVVLLSLSTAAHAFEDDDLIALYDEEELVSIATGTEKHIRFAPSVASVITADDIAKMGARNLEEAIEGVPGIHVSDSILFDDDLISIRGIHTSNNPQVMLLIDGVEIYNLFTAARPAGFRFPLDNVQRIEIIRGPGSAVYGADAFSGVINVITKSGSDINGTEVGGRVGTFDSQDFWVQTGFVDSDGDIEAAFSFDYTKSDGDHNRLIKADGLGAAGQFRSEYEVYNTQVKANIHDWRIRLHNWRLSNGGNGPGGAQVLDDQGKIDVDYYQLDVGYQTELGDSFTVDIRSGYHFSKAKVENVLFPPGIPLFIAPDGNPVTPDVAAMIGAPLIPFPNGLIGNPSADSEVTDFDVTLISSYFDDHTIRVGAGYKIEDFDTGEVKNFGPGVLDILSNPGQVVPSQPQDVSDTPFVFVDDVDREVYYLSIQDEWAFANDWSLTWGVRYDDYSDVGDTVNPRLALVWAARYNVTAKILYGRAFRAPSFTELFSKNNPAQLGNADLDPETIDTIETAIDYRVNQDVTILANVFYYEIDDLIDLVFEPGMGLRAQNAIDQKGKGLEVSLRWEIDDSLDFSSNISIQDIEFDGSNDAVPDVPGAQFFASFNWEPASTWNTNVEVHWIGDRERAPGDTRSDIDDYTLVNLAAKKSFEDAGLEIGLLVKNMFDEDGSEPSEPGAILEDYSIEGRSVFLELAYQIK